MKGNLSGFHREGGMMVVESRRRGRRKVMSVRNRILSKQGGGGSGVEFSFGRVPCVHFNRPEGISDYSPSHWIYRIYSIARICYSVVCTVLSQARCGAVQCIAAAAPKRRDQPTSLKTPCLGLSLFAGGYGCRLRMEVRLRRRGTIGFCNNEILRKRLGFRVLPGQINSAILLGDTSISRENLRRRWTFGRTSIRNYERQNKIV
ncbi:hypothetical protein B0T10DRAFT_272438 [Thelonectria olida]|uniref:Uncharacterized protein n=1 Tax=Thelonectria olida TaxID=1576542 RepID=A0A9P8W8W9_9HYPO|nr:hypothetical protein B0T10DRAFT_272438 [Thelonectria olida]